MPQSNDQSLFMLCQAYGPQNEPITPAYFTGSADQFVALTSQPFFSTLHGGQVLAEPEDFPLYFPMSLDKFELFPIAAAADYEVCF